MGDDQQQRAEFLSEAIQTPPWLHRLTGDELLALLRDEDERARTEFFRRRFIPLFGFTLKEHVRWGTKSRTEDAKDIVSAALFTILTRLYQFKGESKFSTWMYRIVSNRAVDHYTRRGHPWIPTPPDNGDSDTEYEYPIKQDVYRSSEISLVGPDNPRRQAGEADDDYEGRSERHRSNVALAAAEIHLPDDLPEDVEKELRAVMGNLPTDDREILVHRNRRKAYEQRPLSFAKVGDRVGCSEQAAGKRYKLSKKRLTAAIQADGRLSVYLPNGGGVKKRFEAQEDERIERYTLPAMRQAVLDFVQDLKHEVWRQPYRPELTKMPVDSPCDESSPPFGSYFGFRDTQGETDDAFLARLGRLTDEEIARKWADEWKGVLRELLDGMEMLRPVSDAEPWKKLAEATGGIALAVPIVESKCDDNFAPRSPIKPVPRLRDLPKEDPLKPKPREWRPGQDRPKNMRESVRGKYFEGLHVIERVTTTCGASPPGLRWTDANDRLAEYREWANIQLESVPDEIAVPIFRRYRCDGFEFRYENLRLKGWEQTPKRERVKKYTQTAKKLPPPGVFPVLGVPNKTGAVIDALRSWPLVEHPSFLSPHEQVRKSVFTQK